MIPIDTSETIEKCSFVVYKYNETIAMNRVMTLRDQSNKVINFMYVFPLLALRKDTDSKKDMQYISVQLIFSSI